MADKHTIVVRIRDGRVSEVQFCDCCPDILLQIRTYTDSPRAAALATPAWHMEGGSTQQSQFERDEYGVYEPLYYEPDTDTD
jgi:hypothetical protein